MQTASSPRSLMIAFLLAVPLAAQTTPGANSPQSTGQATAQSAANQTSDQPSNQPNVLQTTVTVTGTINSETPAVITTLSSQQIENLPGTEMDDKLRQIPGFSLYRRTSSVVANPTTQGISLRGIGSTGASRTLVLWDGIPVNDPFGGWVYWDRFDPFYIDRVEVVEGAPTSVFGDRAMSGTMSLFSPLEKPNDVWADVIGGNEGTLDASAGYSTLFGRFGFAVNTRDFTTDGYYITPQPVRGSVDTKANVRFATGDVHVDYLGTADRVSIHSDVLAEERQNGTSLTHNSTGIGTIGGNYTHSWTNDQFSLLAFHTQGDFHSTYSSVAANRDSEKETSKQTVPEEDVGGAAVLQHHAHSWDIIGGADVDDIHGVSKDYSFTTHLLTGNGGTLLQHGEFVQGDYKIGPAEFFSGIRQQFTGEHGRDVWDPNAGAAVGLHNFRLHGSIYRSFRAPTLNELFRPFRVGNVETLANPALLPERLTGYELGADWRIESTRISVTGFYNSLGDLIDNATLSVTPTLILRKRENFPTAVSRGLEVQANRKFGKFRAQAGYLYADALLDSGARIPEVPKQQGTAQLIYTREGTLLSFGIRAFGLQFDDDLNQFLLPGYAVLQLSAQQRIRARLSAVASVENLVNRSYLVALTPTPNTGEPRLWRVGLRWAR